MFEKKVKPNFIEAAAEVTITELTAGSFQGQTGPVAKYSGKMMRANDTAMPFEAYGKVLEGIKVGDRLHVRMTVNARTYTYQGVERTKIECRIVDAQRTAPKTAIF